MWGLPGSGIEPVSPAFFITEPPGKPTPSVVLLSAFWGSLFHHSIIFSEKNLSFLLKWFLCFCLHHPSTPTAPPQTHWLTSVCLFFLSKFFSSFMTDFKNHIYLPFPSYISLSLLAKEETEIIPRRCSREWKSWACLAVYLNLLYLGLV